MAKRNIVACQKCFKSIPKKFTTFVAGDRLCHECKRKQEKEIKKRLFG